MIIENKNKAPFIHWGFSKQTINVYVGQEVTLWQDTIYNNYFHSINGFTGDLISNNTNKIVLKFNDLGTQTLSYTVISPDESVIIESNEVTVNVI